MNLYRSRTTLDRRRSEFWCVVSVIRDRLELGKEDINHKFKETNASVESTHTIENDTLIVSLNRTVSAVTSRVETVLGGKFQKEVRIAIRPVVDNVIQE